MSKTLNDLFITNNTKSASQSGVYPLAISNHNLMKGIRKIGIPRKQPRFIKTRSLQHFGKQEFVKDLKIANRSEVDKVSDVNLALQKLEAFRNTKMDAKSANGSSKSQYGSSTASGI